MKLINPEVIQALTPVYIATMGLIIGCLVLINPQLKESQSTAGLGLAGTAIAGAAGLAQSSKGDSNLLQKDVQNIKVEGEPKNELTEVQ